uniref:EamA domain-containing protein n=1 Tax=Chromera velia CCMP2878 TaxID=1169474 RepID=A0A0G4GQU9_9ALVE|eukprot:Cvel_22965.t1-p1 / transcript=Cvel_22965.t1 / gene=Cvel_22965 / organism=Chromera_velia_CCMP2878 / gene_product=hypothetical protein / transcript_product=hypothetical protein / location=Cvel_scaffold2314:13605-15652(-) / protein_length=507 / sequence_SO=supercontig / SO=protein_coding / is_pseudo=false
MQDGSSTETPYHLQEEDAIPTSSGPNAFGEGESLRPSLFKTLTNPVKRRTVKFNRESDVVALSEERLTNESTSNGQSVEEDVIAPSADSAVALCKRRSTRVSFHLQSTSDGRPRQRPSVFSPEFQEQLKSDHPNVKSFLDSWKGILFQGVLVILVTLQYALNPNLVAWSLPIRTDEDGTVRRVQNYFPPALLVFTSMVSSCLCSSLLAVFEDREGLRAAVNFRNHWAFAPVAVGYSLADLFGVFSLSAGGVDATTYALLSQLKLVGTALLLLTWGRGQTGVGWCLLMAISWSMVGYSLEGKSSSGSASGPSATGLICLGIKLSLSIVCGCLCDQRLKTVNAPFLAQLIYGKSLFYGAASAFSFVVQLTFFVPEGWSGKYHFFNGPDGGAPWTWRTVVLGLWYVSKDFAIVALLKHLDVIVKNLANAMSMLLTYGMAVAVFQTTSASFGKLAWVVVVSLQVAAFGIDKIGGRQSGEKEKEKKVLPCTDEEKGEVSELVEEKSVPLKEN